MDQDGEGLDQPYTYTGREWDKETGLYYYRTRYYDPMEGRFISKDPIGFKGGINLFSYVGQNPINRIDPSGKNWYTDDETTRTIVDSIISALLPDAGPYAIASIVSSPEAFATFASMQVKNFNLELIKRGCFSLINQTWAQTNPVAALGLIVYLKKESCECPQF
jgi:RHS repeat-associated protein